MPEHTPILSYATPAQPRTAATKLRITLSGLLGGMLGIIMLAALFGDVDDHWWIFMLVGFLPAAIAAWVTRRRYLPRRAARWTAGVFFGITVLIDVAAVGSLLLGVNILTGEQLLEMGTLLPILWIIGSAVPLLAGAFLLVIARPRTK